MKNIWKKENEGFESSAVVVDDTLVISMPDAINPIVWRMELGNVKASAIEVKQTETGTFNLVLKNPKGDLHTISEFTTKEKAIHVLMTISNALKHAPVRRIMTPANDGFEKKSGVFLKPDEGAIKWLIALGGVLIVIFLYAYMAKNSPNLDYAQDTIQGSTTAPSSLDENGQSAENGVPQSADDLLKGF